MKLIFRADGNSETGLGHMFRLFALVEIYKDNYDYIFITRSNSTLDVIPKEYNLQVIPESIEINEEPIWLEENFTSNEYFIIADGYHFNSNYQLALKNMGYKLMYIDDLAKEKMYADIVVNHSLTLTPSDFEGSKDTIYALGAKYAVLRPSFLQEASQKREINSIKNIFVCFGGADFYNLTEKCVKGLLKLKTIDKISVVVGSAYKHKEIFDLEKDNKDKITIHKSLSEQDMIKLMKNCQLAIVPTSTISYEICAVKMVVLGGYYIDNQYNIYKGFVENELIYAAEDFNEYTPDDFKSQVDMILNDDKNNYHLKINQQQKLFDGKQKTHFLELIQQAIC
ncbi:UDP-2,4-diacetamido-2,4,6-trideoxy-beta-L-altropyranose hydrolase [Winogradskyella sp.]|jgi:UDP-2,4-diacetamido-2,4,6-trideoxy-beta-L-altropyranose hydrolase|uniref:UDP-2,4-diacetamido-2,4, 6-trideoxy-beta-L-altropyranose hydrolase n=1 Tax=Winogradskyella sp. TaxID=1883156 RepID=UPI0025CD85F2|nr:UDP-2,4-diacetamido-2,4,6-trideoxy-beta-L-altropyranose hydrolase [Winogradskyella sp.]MCT4628555.1 UDP-2,4-diacetamido-2,4,6-trideoxy-beta-L-altropyranose hydrolase [Winogradskyella sp.]